MSERRTEIVPEHVSTQTFDIGLLIILASAGGLFAELAVIRLHGSYLPLLAFLKNFSLLSCFLGLGLGFASKQAHQPRIHLFLPLLATQIALLRLADIYEVFCVFGNPLSEETMLGILMVGGLDKLLVFVLVGFIFAFNVATFIPIGELIGSLMNRVGGTASYQLNLIGSLAGVVVFGMVSYLEFGPAVWISISALCFLPFLRFAPSYLLLGMLSVVTATGFVDLSVDSSTRFLFSPYQTLKASQFRDLPLVISVNNLYYQKTLDLSEEATVNNPALAESKNYYELAINSASPSPSVLVVGSGTGNDVAAALRGKARKVTAVEIDPIILDVGKRLHPEAPYQSPVVTAVNTDARKFIRGASEKFDLIVYGLLDSHSLLGGKSGGLRLDSYVYTVEAFREARQLLTPNGLLSLSFVDMGPEFIKKLTLMLSEAFDGQQPLILRSKYDTALTFMSGNQPKVEGGNWLGFAVIDPKSLDPSITADPSTDDWPFFYMARRTISTSLLIFLCSIVAITLFFTRSLLQSARQNFSWRAFWLGAGFMLLETKAITEVALLWGSVFSVTTIVISCILFLALCANFCINKGYLQPSNKHFIFLLLCLLLSYLATFTPAGFMSTNLEMVLRPIILTLPLFFAGLCFSSEVSQEDSSAVVGANLLGAILGGLFEYTATATGFRALYIFVFVFYLLSFAAGRSKSPTSCSFS